MDEQLLAAYRATAYGVRLAQGGRAVIRIGQPLPGSLHSLVGPHAWSVVTAWNPASQPQHRTINRLAQRRLLASLKRAPQTLAIVAADGAADSWHEASLFVIGPDIPAMDALLAPFGQHAYVAGIANGPAMLRRMDKAAGHCGQSTE